tara:strand:- start:98 stop:559 length:462 start_codon:yes stop_codon:yes gene_type:complete
MLTQNPYEAVVVDAPEVRTWAVLFAVSATIAFELSAIASTGNDLSVYVGSPTAVLQNVVPAFVFALLIGWFNGIPSTASRSWITLPGRLLGGCILGTTVSPVNHMVMDYLYLIPLLSKLVEILLVMLVPVVICTMAERVFLRVLGQRNTLGGT